MSVAHSVLAHELSSEPIQSVAAIVYANESYPDAIFKTLVPSPQHRSWNARLDHGVRFGAGACGSAVEPQARDRYG
jgi:hypothetical protein